MSQAPNIDGVLIQWGDRLFYPGNRVVKVKPQPRLSDGDMHQRADAIRKRIEATVVKRAPQVMVKVTGGGRGMLAIAATSATSARTAGSTSRPNKATRCAANRLCTSWAKTGAMAAA